MDPNVITYAQLQGALMRCMTAHPPEGDDYRLHPQASRLIDLFGTMVYDKLNAVPASSVPADILTLYSKWNALPMGGKPP